MLQSIAAPQSNAELLTKSTAGNTLEVEAESRLCNTPMICTPVHSGCCSASRSSIVPQASNNYHIAEPGSNAQPRRNAQLQSIAAPQGNAELRRLEALRNTEKCIASEYSSTSEQRKTTDQEHCWKHTGGRSRIPPLQHCDDLHPSAQRLLQCLTFPNCASSTEQLSYCAASKQCTTTKKCTASE